MNKVLLLTYPRCGSHFFHYCLSKSTNGTISKTHTIYRLSDKSVSYFGENIFNEFDGEIITIARDPFDSITSLMSVRQVKNPEAADDFTECVRYYEESYKFLNSINITWINYNDLKQVNLLTKAISNKFGLSWKPLEDPELKYEEYGTQNIESWKFDSSKTRNTYEGIADRLKQEDLSKCYELYDISVSKCIEITNKEN